MSATSCKGIWGKTHFWSFYEYFGKIETFSVDFFLLNRMMTILTISIG